MKAICGWRITRGIGGQIKVGGVGGSESGKTSA